MYSAHNVLVGQWSDRVTLETTIRGSSDNNTYWVGSAPSPVNQQTVPNSVSVSYPQQSPLYMKPLPTHPMQLVYADENGVFAKADKEDASDPEKELVIAILWKDNLHIIINPYDEKVLPFVVLYHSHVFGCTPIPLDGSILEFVKENLGAVIEILLNNWDESFTGNLSSDLYFPDDIVSVYHADVNICEPQDNLYKKPIETQMSWVGGNSGNTPQFSH